MSIEESSVSILIPTYKYADLIFETVQSALATGAGEVVVLDDDSKDGTIENISRITDGRLVIRQQPKNVGLWRNHRDAINLTSRPWIKFLQADDRLTTGALARMVAEVNDQTTVVWSNPIFKNLDTDAEWVRYSLPSPLRLSSTRIFEVFSQYGFILGTPSHMMVKRTAIDMSDAAWSNDISADVILGVHAASVGHTLLLPSGNVIQGIHAKQDGATQGMEQTLLRLLNTLLYLETADSPEEKRFSAQFAAVESIGLARSLLGHLRKRKNLGINDKRKLYLLLALLARQKSNLRLKPILSNLKVKYSKGVVDLSLCIK